MQKKYVVRLSDSERNALGRLISKRRVSGREVLRARVLLKADAGGPCWRDVEIARAFDCRIKTVENIRERFVTEGFEIALNGKLKSRVRGKVLSGDKEAKIIALRLGPPPKGFANWTLRLLAEQAVALEIVESVSHETLRGTLKKQLNDEKDRVLGDPPGGRC
jgi:Homeodomain-like domain